MMSLEKILNDDKLHIFLLGSGGPMNNEKRVASSIAIIAGGEFILVDIGPGTYRNIDLLRLPVTHLSEIFLTHFHSDHIGDLGEANMMSWVNGRTKPITVHGPEGVDKVVNGFIMAYDFDSRYRIAHHGKDFVPLEASVLLSKPITLKDDNERSLCFDKNGLKVFAFKVNHSPIEPAFGYRIEFKGNIIVITGDTIKTDNLVKHSEDADILFSEAISYELLNNLIENVRRVNLSRTVKLLTDIQSYHMDPITAAKLATEARVKKLVLVHVTPPLLNPKTESLYLDGISEYFDGEVILGEDRMRFNLSPKEI